MAWGNCYLSLFSIIVFPSFESHGTKILFKSVSISIDFLKEHTLTWKLNPTYKSEFEKHKKVYLLFIYIRSKLFCLTMYREVSISFRITITLSQNINLRNNLFYTSLIKTIKIPNCHTFPLF